MQTQKNFKNLIKNKANLKLRLPCPDPDFTFLKDVLTSSSMWPFLFISKKQA